MIWRILIALVLLGWAGNVSAQNQPVYQAGTGMTRGHAAVWQANGAISDAGGSAGSAVLGSKYLTELGITNTGTPFCVDSALTNNAGGYYQLCLGALSLGSGLISYNAYGGAPPLDLKCNINGTTYPCVNTGSGNILGAPPTTINEPVLWNNTAGTLVKDALGVGISHSDTKTGAITADGSPLTVYSDVANGITANGIWACINFAACATSGLPGIYDGIRTVIVGNAGSTMNDLSGFTAYGVSRTGASNAYPLVGFISESIADADNTSVWGADFACSDRYTGGQVISTGTGRFCFNEIDINFTSPSSQGVAWMAGGNSLVQPADVRGFQLNQLDGFPGSPGYVSYGNVARWTSFLKTNSGSTLDFAEIGAAYNPGVFTASTSGTTLTVTHITSGNVSVGATLNGSVSANTMVTACCGTNGTTGYGGLGTYTINNSQIVGSTTMKTSVPSQSVNFNAFDSNGNLLRTIIQEDGAADFIINNGSAVGSTLLEFNLVTVAEFTDTVNNPALEISTGDVRVKGGAGFGHTASGGEGLDIGYDTTQHLSVLSSYDHTGAAYKDFNIFGAKTHVIGSSEVSLLIGGTTIAEFMDAASSSAVEMSTGIVRVDGGAGFGNQPAAGEGLEIGYDTTQHLGLIASYDRSGTANENLQITGKKITVLADVSSGSIELGLGTNAAAIFDGVGLKLPVAGGGMIALAGVATPTVPATYGYVVYEDSADSRLKVKSSGGQINILASPGDVGVSCAVNTPAHLTVVNGLVTLCN